MAILDRLTTQNQQKEGFNSKTTAVSKKRPVEVSEQSSSREMVDDEGIQSSTKRRFMRRGSRAPSMLAIKSVLLSNEIKQAEACDKSEERIEQLRALITLKTPSLKQEIRRSFSLPKCPEVTKRLFQAHLKVAERRRLSLDVLSEVKSETKESSLCSYSSNI